MNGTASRRRKIKIKLRNGASAGSPPASVSSVKMKLLLNMLWCKRALVIIHNEKVILSAISNFVDQISGGLCREVEGKGSDK